MWISGDDDARTSEHEEKYWGRESHAMYNNGSAPTFPNRRSSAQDGQFSVSSTIQFFANN